jgi:hypothetical protein
VPLMLTVITFYLSLDWTRDDEFDGWASGIAGSPEDR